MKVREIMSKNVESLLPHNTLRTAARIMKDHNTGILPVVENGHLLGVITDRDLNHICIALGRDPHSTEVQSVMVKNLSTCFGDDDIEAAAHHMTQRHVKRLAVLNHDKTLAGILSVDDLARCSHELAGRVLEAALPVH